MENNEVVNNSYPKVKSRKKTYPCFTCGEEIAGWRALLEHRQAKHSPPERPRDRDEYSPPPAGYEESWTSEPLA